MFKNFRIQVAFIFLAAFLLSCRHLSPVEKVETKVISIDTVSVVKEDTTVLRMIKPFKEKMEVEMNEVLAYTEEAMVKDRPEGLLNNFVADIILIEANENYTPVDGQKIDFCILNNGGLRTSLPKGEITRGKIFELMPFDNNMVVVTLTGEKILQMFNFVAKAGGVPVSGFSMGIKDTIAVNISLNGKEFDKTKNYKVVTSDYLANGGDKMHFFDSPVKFENMGIKIRDAIITYATSENKKGNKLKSELDKRVYYEK
jgi:2',3'-cyclic-nucleotide 2'-phosphodiesterase (5'-nucleotidase family)